MISRLLLVIALFCAHGELLASVRVFIKHVPVDQLIQKFKLKGFPAHKLKQKVELVPSAAAFTNELQQASCLSCFDKIFDADNFKRYVKTSQTNKTQYVESYADALRKDLNTNAYNRSSFWRDNISYDVTVAYDNDEAVLVGSLLDSFAELDEFYRAMGAAQRQLDANMPATGVRREAFIAQQEKYWQLYQQSRAEIGEMLADLRSLLDEHGRDYPKDILANVDNLRAHLRKLIQARKNWNNNIETTVTDNVTPLMNKLQKRGHDLYAKELDRTSAQQEELRGGLSADLDKSDWRSSYKEDYASEDYASHDDWYRRQQQQQADTAAHHAEEQRRQQELDDMMGAAIVLDIFDGF